VDLALTNDQETLREVFTDVFAGQGGPERARAAEPLGFDPDAWGRLLETGAPGMGVAESRGGGGATLADLAVVAEEYGAAIAPLPLVEHAVAARLLAGLDACPDGLLAGVVEGTEAATLALRPAVDGVAEACPAAAVATHVVALDDDRLVVASGEASMTALANHGCLPLAHRPLDGAIVVAEGNAAHAAHGRALDEWRTLTAAALVGNARTALDLAVEYVKERHQFGRPIGAFQAVQQLLADLPGLLDGARLLAAKAAWSGDLDPDGNGGTIDLGTNDVTDFPALASMALVAAGEAAATATDRSLHVHGGYGFSEEYDIQLFYRRARAWALVLDDPARECRRLADLLLESAVGDAA